MSNLRELKVRIRNYTKVKSEKKELEIRLSELNDIAIKGIDYSKDTFSVGAITSSTENQAINITEVQEKLNNIIKYKSTELSRIDNALEVLNDKEREIIELKYIKDYSWETVSYKCNRSLMTIRRIEKEAFNKMLNILNYRI